MTILQELLSGVTNQLLTGVIYTGGTIPNLVLELSGLNDYIAPELDKTFSAGNVISTVTNGAEGESDWIITSGDTGMTYDDGNDYFQSTAETERLMSNFASGEGRTFGCVIEIPSTLTSNINIFQLGSGATPLNNTRLLLVSNGSLRWYSNESGSFDELTSLGGLLAGDRHAFIFNLVNKDTVNLYINNGTTPAFTFNPNDALVATNRNRIMFGGGAARYVELFTSSTLLDGADVLAIMENMKARRGVTQSNAPFSINEFTYDMQPFGGGIAYGNNSADIPISGTGFDGQTVQARVVKESSKISVTGYNSAVIDANGDWSMTLTNVPRCSDEMYRIEYRIGSAVKYSTKRFRVENVFQDFGQSETEYLIRDIYDDTSAESVIEDNRVQFFIDSDDAVRTVRQVPVYEGNTDLTSAMIAMANTFMREKPSEYFTFIFNAQGGTSVHQLVDDEGTVYSSYGDSDDRQWARDENFTEVVTDDGGHVDVVGMSWYSAHRAIGSSYEDAFFPVLFGKLSSGTAIGAKPYTHNYDSGEDMIISHDMTELYNYTKTKVLIFDSHPFMPFSDFENGLTPVGGSPAASPTLLEACRLSARDIPDNVNATSILGVGIANMHYKNGSLDGGNFNDFSHPSTNDADGNQLKAKLMAVSYMQATGLLSFDRPVIDNCTWTASYVDVWSSAGDITTTRIERGLPALDDTQQDHWTEVVGFEINDVPAVRAEVVSGRVRVYPNSGTFSSSDVLTFGRGGGSGILLRQQDSVAGLHLNYPIVDTGLSSVEGVSVAPMPSASVLSNTL